MTLIPHVYDLQSTVEVCFVTAETV